MRTRSVAGRNVRFFEGRRFGGGGTGRTRVRARRPSTRTQAEVFHKARPPRLARPQGRREGLSARGPAESLATPGKPGHAPGSRRPEPFPPSAPPPERPGVALRTGSGARITSVIAKALVVGVCPEYASDALNGTSSVTAHPLSVTFGDSRCRALDPTPWRRPIRSRTEKVRW